MDPELLLVPEAGKRPYMAAQVASKVCLLVGWAALVSGVAGGVLVAANPPDYEESTDKVVRGLLAALVAFGGVVTWAVFVALGSLVAIGIAHLQRQ